VRRNSSCDSMNEALQTSWMAGNTTFLFPSLDEQHHPAFRSTGSDEDEHTGRDIVRHRLINLRARWDRAVSYILGRMGVVVPRQDSSGEDVDGDHGVGVGVDEKDDILTKTIDSWYHRILSSYSNADRSYHTLCHLEEMFEFLDLLTMVDGDGDDPNKKYDDDNDDPHKTPGRSGDTVREENGAVLTMAVFFHDVVYRARSDTNEDDSATWYRQFELELWRATRPVGSATDSTGGGTEDPTVPTTRWSGASDTVVEFILATKSHTVADEGDGTTGDDRIVDPLLCFLDADMAVLGKRPEAYDHYAALIREEYIHVPHDIYCEKRAEILESFLSGVGGAPTTAIFRTAAMHESLEARAVANLRREIDTLRRGVIPSLADGVK